MLTKRKLLIVACLLVALSPFALAWLAAGALSAPVNHAVGQLPGDLNGAAVEFQSASGATVRAWLVKGQPGAGVVVLMHGVRADRLSMLGRARFLAAAGYGVLLFDFQAHGESRGERITFGYLESRDARAAIDFVRTQLPGERIGVVGVSMGGAAALLAQPPLEVDALVLEMVYPTINEAVTDRLRLWVGGGAVMFAPLLTWQFRPRLGVGAEALRPVDHVGTLTMPKLLIAGADDRHTTLAESRRMFAAAAAPKELWVVPGARHMDLHAFARADYEAHLLSFFARHLRRQG